MVKPSDPSPGGLDINAVYSPGTAATEVEQTEASEEAALGRSGANGLLAVTILELIGTTVMAFVLAPAPPPAFELAFAYGFVGVFAGLYVWARSNPYPACITGLSLFIGLHLLAAIADPSSLAQGIIIKVVVISVLGSSIRNIQRYRAQSAAAR